VRPRSLAPADSVARLCALALLLVAPGVAIAEERHGPPASASEASLRAIPPILDPAFRHQKRWQLELSPHGGSYLGRSVGSSFLAGLRADLHLSQLVAVGVTYDYSRLQSPSALQPLPADRELHSLLAEASLSNDLAMRIGKKLIALDLFLTLGIGGLRITETWKVAGLVGGGVKFYTGLPWLAVRIDLQTHIHPTPTGPDSQRIDTDLSLALGLSFFLPARASAYER
jgi:hypothetical protein